LLGGLEEGVYFLAPNTMKTRAVEEISRDLKDANTRLEDLERHGDEAMDPLDLRHGRDAVWAAAVLTNCLRRWGNELSEATKHGVQMSLGI